MNTYNNVDVLSSQREDISSNCTLIPSLAEHSYCASNLSSSSEPQEPVIRDLFESSSELCQDMDTTIKFPIEMEDVNLDGFNYTVPAVPTDGGGEESMQLESMWGELPSDTDTAVVEVAATNEEDASSAKAHKSKPRRTDYLKDPDKRRSHFDIYFGKLKSDFDRIKSRTGCRGSLSASFEGKSYDGTILKVDFVSSSGNDRPSSSAGQSTVTSTNECLAHDGMDDHRYAATMLTQNISSSAVRDHQYDEKTITSAPESDTTDDDNDSANHTDGKMRFKRNNSKRYRYDFIKVRWERTQTFSKVVRSLFTSKVVLEKRTGADIKLTVEYEGISFNEENYKNAFSIIGARRKQLKLKKFNLRSKEATTSVQQPVHISATPTPLTFILPNFASFPFQVPCIIPQTSEHILEPCGQNPVSVTCTLTSASQSVPDTTFNLGESSSRRTSTETANISNTDTSIPTIKLIEYATPENSITLSRNERRPTRVSEETGSIPTPFIPVIEGVPDIGEQLLTFENCSSPQKSPEVSIAREMKESSTNTEPNCSICMNSTENSSRQRGGGGADHSKAKSFWIRCNDPFCYEMVHASCVGFVVTHSAHLKQLPAYYCKYHR